MRPVLREVTEKDEFDFVELLSGNTSDFTVGKLYEVLVDDGSIFTEGELYVIDNTYTNSTEMFYNPHLQLRYYKKTSE
ncbi:hypothetical protein E2R58_15040 [Paenibacillus amylolyticus]|uniref:hypothetical protein n=1 Tax=Paenibacillus amylolyticus TaxID=1451 RepID=UPI00105AA869|nr:hypothetical protein [Paenibacillus amylolyticus]TDL70395.1 hypothetical protein E2R58_15040 [Paenibacillus amylolyticus]